MASQQQQMHEDAGQDTDGLMLRCQSHTGLEPPGVSGMYLRHCTES